MRSSLWDDPYVGDYTGYGHSRRVSMTVLVTVKAYPTVSQQHGEAVCVAGIRLDVEPHEWVRLFPVPYRDLADDQQFRKWQVIDLEAQRTATDRRPESFAPIVPTIRLGPVVDTKKEWAQRRLIVEPFLAPSMCEVRRQRKVDNTSLALIRPRKVAELEISPVEEGWTAGQRGIIHQGRLDDDLERSRESLEELPYKFHYRYHCADPDCPGHRQSVLDWEIGQAYRKFRTKYPDENTTLDKIREKWLGQLTDARYDTSFFVGNAHQHPDAFMVLGVFWPPARQRPAQEQLDLF